MKTEHSSEAQRPHEPTVALTKQVVGLSPDAKAAFVIDAVAEKKDRVREAAVEQRFCPDRACASLDVLAHIITRLDEKSRARFIEVVATPLMAREPMDLLKITLATKSFEQLSAMSLEGDRPGASFMKNMLIERMGRDLANGKWDHCAQGEMLPLSSRAIVYLLEQNAEPHKDVIREKMRAMCDVLTASRMHKDAPESLISSTRHLYVDYGDGRQHDYHGVVVAGHLTLVVEPHTSPTQLASTFIHEDLHLFFEKHFGAEAAERGATRSSNLKPVPKETPLVAPNNRTSDGLLSEFHSYVQQAAFDNQLLRDGIMSRSDAATFLKNWKGLKDDMTKALTVLRACEKRGDFSERGSALLQDLSERLEATDVDISKHKEKLMLTILRERLGMPPK